MSTRVHDLRRIENFKHNHKHVAYNHHKHGNSVFNGYGKRYEEESNKGGFGKTLGLVALAAGAYGIGTSRGSTLREKTGNFFKGIIGQVGNFFTKRDSRPALTTPLTTPQATLKTTAPTLPTTLPASLTTTAQVKPAVTATAPVALAATTSTPVQTTPPALTGLSKTSEALLKATEKQLSQGEYTNPSLEDSSKAAMDLLNSVPDGYNGNITITKTTVNGVTTTRTNVTEYK